VASLVGAGASWVAGGLACSVLVVVVALAFPALLRYRSHSVGGALE
jgi:hypothetical protein